MVNERGRALPLPVGDSLIIPAQFPVGHFVLFGEAPLVLPRSAREITFQKNSYFPHVSGMGEYCVRQTSGLLFKCRCKFSDTGLNARK